MTLMTLEQMKNLVEKGRLRYGLRQYQLGKTRSFLADARSYVKKGEVSYEQVLYISENYPNIDVQIAMKRVLNYYPEHKSEDKNLVKLVSILKKETKTLKEQYVEKIMDHAGKRWDNVSKTFSWEYKDWFEKYKEERKSSFRSKVINTSDIYFVMSNDGHNAMIFSKKIEKLGRDGFIKEEKNNAIEHYNNSITKLALRVNKKGMNVNNIKTSTSHIGVNISTILDDGEQIVEAYTIIASGEIQKPHYRYLVK